MSNAVSICSTADAYHPFLDMWLNDKIDNYDKFVIIDITKNKSFDKGFVFTENDLRKSLKFNHDVSKKHYWNSYGNRNITWFFAHLRMLNLYLDYPDYDYYWLFDDDVKIDDWSDFLNNVDKDTSDFISYFVFKDKGVISQPNIPEIDNRTTSQHMWFERFPGDGDTLPKDIIEYFGSFFPTTRYSNKAMSKLLELNNDNYFGYSEGFVPTMLNKLGMSLNTLIKSDNTSDLFDNKSNKVYHKNSIIDWEWV